MPDPLLRRSRARRLRPLPAVALLAVALLAPTAGSGVRAQETPAAPPGGVGAPLDSSATLVRFHDYAFHVPASEGWQLLRRAPEDESIAVQLVWQREGERFPLGRIGFARLGLFDPDVPRRPAEAFDSLSVREERAARYDALERAHLVWLGAGRDTFSDGGRTFYRLTYGVRSGDTEGHAWAVFWFPQSFASDGFYIRATLEFWRAPDREDLSVLEDFAASLRTLRAIAPERDRRIIRDGPDPFGKAGIALPQVYYDTRAEVLNSPHDTLRAPCAVQLEDTVAVVLQPTQLPGVTFFSFHEKVPAPGDRSPGERFGKAFDRDRDGRFDLVYFSQGWMKGVDQRDIRTFYVVADDDGDGRVDGIVFEDGDNDRDALVDHSLFVQDRDLDGAPDRAWVFDTDIAHPVRPSAHQGTVFLLNRTSHPGRESFDFAEDFRDWTRRLDRLNRALEACPERGGGRP